MRQRFISRTYYTQHTLCAIHLTLIKTKMIHECNPHRTHTHTHTSIVCHHPNCYHIIRALNGLDNNYYYCLAQQLNVYQNTLHTIRMHTTSTTHRHHLSPNEWGDGMSKALLLVAFSQRVRCATDIGWQRAKETQFSELDGNYLSTNENLQMVSAQVALPPCTNEIRCCARLREPGERERGLCAAGVYCEANWSATTSKTHKLKPHKY